MGIYVKKKRFNFLNVFLIFLFLIIVLTTLYFFKIFSEKTNFDLYRKTLNQPEVQKDIKRFSNLTSLEMEYYLIWGYPYLFEFSNHHISVSDITKEITFDNSIKSLNYSNISLMKQDSLNGKFISICESD